MVQAVGILSPGMMGNAVGEVLRANGLRVLTSLDGRSDRTRHQAADGGFVDVGSLESLVREADMLLSILTPAAARDAGRRVASAIRETGADILFVECNFVAPRTVREISDEIVAAGGRVADAGIFGPPPRQPGTPIYTSGPGAAEFAQLRDYGLDIRVLGGGIGQASAMEMCAGGLLKGFQALALELLVAARAWQVEAPLGDVLEHGSSELLRYLERAAPGMPRRARRYAGEMVETVTFLEDLGLPAGAFDAAGAFYRFAAEGPLGEQGGAPDLGTILETLANQREGSAQTSG